MEIAIYVGIIIFGLFSGSIFNRIGNILSNKKDYTYHICNNCNHKIRYLHISTFSYIFNLARCKYCKRRISIFPTFVEISTAALFLIVYLKFSVNDPIWLNLLYALLFISSLIIIIVSDVEYMLIPDKILIVFGILLAIIKLLFGYYNEEYKNLLDVGYSIIFLLYDGLFMFFIMYLIKLFGDFLLKKDSMGGGDIKLMFYISMILGWKLSIIVVFLAAFLALPFSIINMLRKDQAMLAFGPYLAIASIILFLTNVDFNTIISYII